MQSRVDKNGCYFHSVCVLVNLEKKIKNKPNKLTVSGYLLDPFNKQMLLLGIVWTWNQDPF